VTSNLQTVQENSVPTQPRRDGRCSISSQTEGYAETYKSSSLSADVLRDQITIISHLTVPSQSVIAV
jgi:hypothetical protein